MFNIPASVVNQFKDKKIYENHVMNISACNIFFYHIKLIAHRPTLLNRKDYYEYFNMFSDIELKTAPMDTFVEVPDEPEEETDDTETEEEKSFEALLNEMPHIVEINRLCPEFIKIQDRITKDVIINNFPEDHVVIQKMNDDEEKCIDDLTVDCFIHWCIEQYLKNIDKLRLALISNATPVIEWTVENITLKDIKNYLSTTKNINDEKCHKYAEDIFFRTDFNYTSKFYKELENDEIKSFDVNELMKKLISNEVIKSDIYIIIAIYMILTYCKVPISENTKSDEKCVTYVRDVISQI